MAELWFQIDLAMPVAMSAKLQRDVIAAIRPRWHVTKIEMLKLDEGVFRLKLFMTTEDPSQQTPKHDDLREFRDLIVSLVAFSAMVPVQLRSRGIFDSPDCSDKRKQVSLGPMDYEFPPTPLSDL